MTKKIHAFYLFLMSFILLLLVLFSVSNLIILSLYLFLLSIFFFSDLAIKRFIKITLLSLFMAGSMLLLSLLYPAAQFKMGPLITVFNWPIYQAVLDNSKILFLRLFFLSSISLTSSAVIDYHQLLMFFMQKKILPVIVGYPILIAINSISLLKDEQERIDINAKFRGLKWHKRIFIFLPLMVFAIRHSQRGAMALMTRGLNQDKSYFNNFTPVFFDLFIFLLFLMISCILLLYPSHFAF